MLIDPGRVVPIWDLPKSTSLKLLQTFLGTIRCYRRYLKDLCTSARLLYRLTAKITEWNMDEVVNQASIKMKEYPTMAPVLGYPDPNRTYLLDTSGSRSSMVKKG